MQENHLTGRRKMEFHIELDLREHNCPIPILKTMLTFKHMDHGQVMKVLTSDTGSPSNMAAFCRTSGAIMAGTHPIEDGHIFLIQRR